MPDLGQDTIIDEGIDGLGSMAACRQFAAVGPDFDSCDLAIAVNLKPIA
jgi:hypothetical protein